MKTVLITGCNGFIARNITKELKLQGFFLIGISSSDENKYNYDIFQKCQLGTAISDDILNQRIDVVIHTAYFAGENEYQINLDGTIYWAKQLLNKYIKKQVFLSSISSQRNSLSDYGKAKFDIGEWFVSNGLTSINLGLVVGRGGMFEKMYRIFGLSPILPLVDSGSETIYFLGINELVFFITKYCKSDLAYCSGSHIMFFQPKSITLKELFNALSSVTGKRRYYISIPSKLVYNFLTFWEKIVKIKLPINKNNLQGLKQNLNLKLSSDYFKFGIQDCNIEEVIRKNLPIA